MSIFVEKRQMESMNFKSIFNQNYIFSQNELFDKLILEK